MQNTASATAQTEAQMADASAAPKDRPTRGEIPVARLSPPAGGSEARRQDLRHRARAEDVLHWQQHQRPISAETLRKRLHVGAGTARGLVAQLRSDTHVALDGVGEATTM